MSTTRFLGEPRTEMLGADGRIGDRKELADRYEELIAEGRTQWTTYHRLEKRLGRGGQGTVYLSQRRGTDGFTIPIAMKIFSPYAFDSQSGYEQAMLRIGTVAARVAQIQHSSLIAVHDFVDRNQIRIMMMEWVDGYDLRKLMSLQRFVMIGERMPEDRWKYVNSVIWTAGPEQARFKAGIAVAIVRDCLSALAALHREGIIHGDIKPANIMLKRLGQAKLIDIGSAFEIANPPLVRMCTPTYAAPEVLENSAFTTRSDLASLGYCLIELLSGKPCFANTESIGGLLEQKRALPRNLEAIMPPEVACNKLLMNFCRGLIAPDPGRRFPTAEAADLLEDGAASFHRQLVLGNLDTEYDNDLRIWLEELRPFDAESEDLFNDDEAITNSGTLG